MSATSLFNVSPAWLQTDELLKIGLKISDRKIAYEEGLSWEKPTAIEGLTNFRYDSFLINDEICSLYICQHQNLKLIDKQSETKPELYSFISLINETAYIRQEQAHSAKAAYNLWITNKSPPWYSVQSFNGNPDNIVLKDFEPFDRLVGIFKATIQSDYGQGVAYRILTEA